MANEFGYDDYELLEGINYSKGDFTGITIHTSFLKKGYVLEKRPEKHPDMPAAIAIPYEMNVRLYLIKGKSILKRINSLSDLHGYVNIDSKEKAKEFVRLRTSNSTNFLFRPEIMVEIYKQDKKRLDKDWEKRLKKHGIPRDDWHGIPGGTMPEFFGKNNLSGLQIEKSSRFFEIKRFLLRTVWPGSKNFDTPLGKAVILRVKETVSSEGEYSMEEEIFRKDVKRGDVVVPGIPK
ncbi:MAG: hypothetical protein HY754_04520 [Nitrospirae bacterium]|nr:hypothetical protein [Nitrospirota bacterium]